ncbi:hypothetical protein Hamer_G010955 [Homarus americanus]|uniref:Uncharacterized protein n=1 Tax=Homarus americanus TaxID=6706 RepID=A0A8J5JWY1_HOMAM|nr:hypothetical protein Hamer_G010955 [Homarus americanus]
MENLGGGREDTERD